MFELRRRISAKVTDSVVGNGLLAGQSLKDCTARNIKTRKMSVVTKILYWLVDNSTKVRDIQSAMESIQDLGKAEVGYFDMCRTNCNDKGRLASLNNTY